MILENFASGPDRYIDTTEPGFEKPAVGDVVAVTAVDWAIYSAQRYNAHEAFDIVRGTVYGQVVRVNDEMIAVAMQAFDDGGLRQVLALPWVTVEKVVLLEKAENRGIEVGRVESLRATGDGIQVGAAGLLKAAGRGISINDLK